MNGKGKSKDKDRGKGKGNEENVDPENIEADNSTQNQVLMFVAGKGGTTKTYRENLEDIGLFQNVDSSKIFS